MTVEYFILGFFAVILFFIIYNSIGVARRAGIPIISIAFLEIVFSAIDITFDEIEDIVERVDEVKEKVEDTVDDFKEFRDDIKKDKRE